MRQSLLLVTVGKFLFPFVLLFGIYICLNGDTSIGGGFQGGVILASAYLLYFLIKGEHPFSINKMLKADKFIFIVIIILLATAYFVRGEMFTNYLDVTYPLNSRRIQLIVLNLLIGLKVSIGFVALIFIFIKEGRG